MIKVYAEYHGPKRRPNIEYYVNDVLTPHTVVYESRINERQENIIVEFDSSNLVSGPNKLKIIMNDKTDNDRLCEDGTWYDHFVEIKDIEIDTIKFEAVLFLNCANFTHTMPDEWVLQMNARGINIDKTYCNSTELRLNGELVIEFDSPFWLWYTKKLASA